MQQQIGIFEAIVLGFVQGITEYFPISSTAHLRVVPALLGWADPGTAYSAVIQLGSLLAVLTYFYKDLVEILSGTVRALRTGDTQSREVRLFWGIILGTIPIVIAGLALKSTLEAPGSPLRALSVIAVASIVMAALLWLSESLGKRTRTMKGIRVIDGILIGCAQALALVPGVSRSGSTLTAALFLGFQRADGARFSFLLAIPAIFLSGLLELKVLVDEGFSGGIGPIVAGFVSSTVFSYLAIAWLLKFLQTRSTLVFVIYRFFFGALLLGLLAAGLLPDIEPVRQALNLP
ncbi:undecaprenyl-diphosphate phosphatase [Gloeobacter violaceus]|uniref:Undecaprenyl-diphosphatase n=1 Tax=Gloeobacter violaceus (strain ATCC 29082 / PCC 7421) TaxID=251221 RepID=UPPP_GLOVI|nr:undecaprenyl-diphosphate phosphatase [Gloeobacter violaceus]Q7NG92.1 RecName: Full=Undecaprenyl-diphosphatase; AltName: Full=Bacitracin resistance protein; AltName: Full=Undecaprenyl pyrophosphate phosphatase [Gloeobacter violaceus PCC 7421]BAC91222.1 glr3281 [Gloeobacter violaceus PCC 7421]